MTTHVLRAVPFLLVLTAPGCVSVEYTGREYPPTDAVLVYRDLEDMAQPGKVFGHLQAEVELGADYQAVERELAERAMHHGANALVVEGADMVDAGARTPGRRPAPVRYVRGDDGVDRRSAPGPVPRFTHGLGDRVLNAMLVRFPRGALDPKAPAGDVGGDP
ncbi:MAG: hypothetical protein AB7O97_20135 [Planctomycetota bacterium]